MMAQTRRVLMLAPHPDDEVLGCSALIAQALNEGAALRVVVVSDGAGGGDAAVRREEVLAGLGVLGVPATAVDFWNEPDGAIPLRGPILARYRQLVRDWAPTQLALPAPGEAHPDHRRVTRGALAALTDNWRGELVFYETTTPLVQCSRVLPLDLTAKLAALRCHASQCARYDYAAHAQGMALLRGASIGVAAAEGYLAFGWDGSAQNFFEQRPLVSLIMRADCVALASVALASVRAQAYDQLEVVLVWHGDDPLPAFASFHDLAIRVIRGPGPRAANLNAGVDAAQGAMIGFLDQDDVLLPDHCALLLAELMADATCDIAYGDAWLCHCRVADDGAVTVLSRVPMAGRDPVPGRLLLGNHVPFHALLMRRSVAQRQRFNTALEAYEDWEFLALAELGGARMSRVAEPVCEYRVYPQDGEADDLATIHARKGYPAARPAVLASLFAALDLPAFEQLVAFATDHEARAAHHAGRAEALQRERDGAVARASALEARLAALATWADRLCAPWPSVDPLLRLAGAAFGDGAVFAVIMPVCDPEPAHLIEAVHSVMAQVYGCWQLCIADDASTRADVQAVLSGLAREASHDPRLRLVRRAARGGIVAASQSALALAGPDASWLAFVDHDDVLAPDALLELAAAVRASPDLTAVYSDSRTIDANGNRINTYAKPDWSPETLLHVNYINHLTVVRRDAFEAVGGLRSGLDGSQDWDLWLRLSRCADFSQLHVARPLYDWRAASGSLATGADAKPYAMPAACRAVAEHLGVRLGQPVETRAATPNHGVVSCWSGALQPMTVVIPTHRNREGIRRLVEDLARQDYPELAVVVVANRVADAPMQALLRSLPQRPGWRVIEDDRPFNWAALNNRAVRQCVTPWLLFLNDDVSLGGSDWLRGLVRYLALDAAVGVVGARLDYPSSQGAGVQHDGVVTDPEWVAANITAASQDGGFGMPRNVAAVTGACLLSPRAVFDRCGGFDERFAESFNDVDYCLMARRVGYRVVQASDMIACHDESKTRGEIADPVRRARLFAERDLMRAKWGAFLRDPHRLHYQRRYALSRVAAFDHD